MKKAAVAIGLVLMMILVCASCYVAGFVEGYEMGRQLELLPYIWR